MAAANRRAASEKLKQEMAAEQAAAARAKAPAQSKPQPERKVKNYANEGVGKSSSPGFTVSFSAVPPTLTLTQGTSLLFRRHAHRTATYVIPTARHSQHSPQLPLKPRVYNTSAPHVSRGWWRRMLAQSFTFGRLFESAYLLAAAVVAKEYFSKGNVSTEELSAKVKGEFAGIDNKPVVIAYGVAALVALSTVDFLINLPVFNILFPALFQAGGILTASALFAKYKTEGGDPEADFKAFLASKADKLPGLKK